MTHLGLLFPGRPGCLAQWSSVGPVVTTRPCGVKASGWPPPGAQAVFLAQRVCASSLLSLSGGPSPLLWGPGPLSAGLRGCDLSGSQHTREMLGTQGSSQPVGPQNSQCSSQAPQSCARPRGPGRPASFLWDGRAGHAGHLLRGLQEACAAPEGLLQFRNCTQTPVARAGPLGSMGLLEGNAPLGEAWDPSTWAWSLGEMWRVLFLWKQKERKRKIKIFHRICNCLACKYQMGLIFLHSKGRGSGEALNCLDTQACPGCVLSPPSTSPSCPAPAHLSLSPAEGCCAGTCGALALWLLGPHVR